MGVAINRLAREDPSFRVSSDPESGQTIIKGMGELHLESLVDRMKREFKVEANVGAAQVAYREYLKKPVDVDYTHKNFGGRGTVNAYKRNNPNVIEPGSFPTKKVIGGYDFVGPDYSVTDDDPTNDVPRPDPDPIDDGIKGDHGSHTAGIVGACAGPVSPGTSRAWLSGSEIDA